MFQKLLRQVEEVYYSFLGFIIIIFFKLQMMEHICFIFLDCILDVPKH